MADGQFIPPFPEEIDRISFGHYLSGFTDGEGSFILSWTTREHTRSPYAKFVIALRNDDREILERIQSYFQCGCLNYNYKKEYNNGNSKLQCRIVVSSARDLAEIIVPHYEQFPLRAKKARDFVLWKQGVELVRRVSSRPMTGGGRGFRKKWTDFDRNVFQAIAEDLKEIRKYESPPGFPMPPPLPKPSEFQGSFGFN